MPGGGGLTACGSHEGYESEDAVAFGQELFQRGPRHGATAGLVEALLGGEIEKDDALLVVVVGYTTNHNETGRPQSMGGVQVARWCGTGSPPRTRR
jgi:hypothetical protein